MNTRQYSIKNALAKMVSNILQLQNNLNDEEISSRNFRLFKIRCGTKAPSKILYVSLTNPPSICGVREYPWIKMR